MDIQLIHVITVANPANKTFTNYLKSNLMQTKPCHTQEDYKRMAQKCREICKLEDSLTEKELKWMLYQLGVVVYRRFHKAGIPVDVRHPGLNQPKKVWSSVLKRSVDERLIEALEAEVEQMLVAA